MALKKDKQKVLDEVLVLLDFGWIDVELVRHDFFDLLSDVHLLPPSCALDVHASVDPEHLPGDIARFFARQKQNRRRDLLGPADPP